MSSFYNKHYTIASLLEAGVHYGHLKRRWNPKMAPYIYGVRNDTHIIDLRKTVEGLEAALPVMSDCVAKNGRILFLSTKKQAAEFVAESAQKCGQYYVNNRWLGGMLTNWSTVSSSMKRLASYESMLNDPEVHMLKKERLSLQRKFDKLNRNLGGMRKMGGVPDLLFVIGVNEHKIAIREAKAMNIKVCAVADTNVDPEGIDYLIPGNDDALRSIKTYCDLASTAILQGLQKSLNDAGVDVGVENADMIAPDAAGAEIGDGSAAGSAAAGSAAGVSAESSDSAKDA